MSKRISFVIPCYKSEATIETVVAEIRDEVSRLQVYDYEIVAVDDNSPDHVFDVLCRLALNDARIKVLRFARNFGQHAGMLAGLRAATGDYIVFLDDDGQCPMDHLRDLLVPLLAGADVAIARYGKKKQSFFKNLCSRGNEFAAEILVGKPKELQLGNFMALTRGIASEMCHYTGPYPYISGLFLRASDKIVNVPMPERERMNGVSTYTFRKLFSLWLNSFTAFSIKPLQWVSFWGAMIAVLGMGYGGIIVASKLINPAIAIGWSSIMAALLLLGGMILFVLGMIGEYLGRMYLTISQTPQYVIREQLNVKRDGGQK